MAKGNLVGCFGLTEPDAGSDPGSMKTVSKKVEGGYILNWTEVVDQFRWSSHIEVVAHFQKN